MDSLLQDLRYAARTLRRAPGFSAVAIVTLALGIGANTAIFSVVNAVLLRPLPYADADRLVRIVGSVAPTDTLQGPARRVAGMTVADIAPFRAETKTLSHVGFYIPVPVTLVAGDEAIRLEGTRIAVDGLAMLGIRPIVGRIFEPKEEVSGGDAVIILSYPLWQRAFAGAADVVGRSLTLDGRAYTVVGVMPRGFDFPDAQSQFWVPFVASQFGRVGGSPIARLKDGVSIEAATAEVSRLVPQVRATREGTSASAPRGPAGYELVRLQDLLVSPVRPALMVLTVAVGFVLLIACVNVANLLLARTASRRREIAVRIALGAGRGRLLAQTLTESLLLAVAGGIGGTALAYGGVRLLQMLGAALPRRDIGPGVGLPRLDEIAIDARVLMFTLAVSIATGIAFGVMPALRRAGPNPMQALREGGGTAGAGFNLLRARRGQGLLVVAEIAMATMLFLGGGLLIRSLANLSNVDPGYDATHLLTAQVSMTGRQSSAAQLTTFADDVVDRLRQVPRVRGVAYARQLPMVRFGQIALLRTTPAMPQPMPTLPPPGARRPADMPDVRVVSRDFLRVMGIRIVAGRGFGDQDSAGRPQVLLINRTLARSGILGDNPIGKQIYALLVGQMPWEVVGVVDDVHQFDLDREPDPQIFIDYRQEPPPPVPRLAGSPPPAPYFAVRTDGSPMPVAADLRRIVQEIEPQAAVDNVATMEQIVANSLARPRLYAVLLGIFAGVAVALTAIGIYGVMAYSVAQRTREIGIRMALGAYRHDVMRLVLAQSVAVTAIGIIAGVAAAAALSRYLRGLLFGLTPLDPSTFVGVAVTFAAIAVAAAYVPARRATNVDPLVALRCE